MAPGRLSATDLASKVRAGGGKATLKTAEGENYTLIDKLKRTAKFDGAKELITIDGLRVEYADGFGLARPSNTTPVVVLRFEADDAAALARIQEDFKRALLAVKPDAQLPF